MGANPERAKSIWFSSAYAPFLGAFAKPDVELDSVKGFSGKKVSDWWHTGRLGNPQMLQQTLRSSVLGTTQLPFPLMYPGKPM